MVIGWIIVVIDKIPPPDIINIAISIIINTVIRNFPRVVPDIWCEIAMGIQHPGVDHGNNDAARTR